MGKIKYQPSVENLFKKSFVVTAASIDRLIKNKNYSKQLIHNLIKKGKIKKLAKGCYSSRDDPSIAVFCFKPAYLGLQDALSFHNLWEQETIPVIITATKTRPGIRKILGANVLVKRIARKYMFGFDYFKCSETLHLPYSDIEKTLIDFVYFKQKLNSETLAKLRKKIDMNRLHKYLKVYPRKLREQALDMITSVK